ncbi:MAG: MBL fold metallo-hydrolase [Treponema sp.]|nr:MBL fold metallo-hydrolase [Treponema sp.]
MKVYFHYCLYGFSNCYIIGTEGSGAYKTNILPLDVDLSPSGNASDEHYGPSFELKEAIIVDPGCMDEKIIDFLERNEYALRGVLITHDHQNHVHGLRTLKKIYDVPIYALNHEVCEHKTVMIKDGDVFPLGPFTVEVFSVPGHSADSAVYKVSHVLFTGDAMTAGLIGSTNSSYGASLEVSALRSKILSLPGDYVVLPGHGPPSTLEAERRFNTGFEQKPSTAAGKTLAFIKEFL